MAVCSVGGKILIHVNNHSFSLYYCPTGVWSKQPAVAAIMKAVIICQVKYSGLTQSATVDACVTAQHSRRCANRGVARPANTALWRTGFRTASPWASRPAPPRETHTFTPLTAANLIFRETACTSLPVCVKTQRDWRSLRWEWQQKKKVTKNVQNWRFRNIAASLWILICVCTTGHSEVWSKHCKE